MRKVVQLSAMGVSMGCTIFVFIGIILSLTNGNGVVFADARYEFVRMAVCSMIVGMGFSLPTLIYGCNRVARALQALIHLATGFIIFGTVAIYAGWIPFARGATSITIFVVGSVAVTMIIWACFYLYYKKEAEKINEGIKKK